MTEKNKYENIEKGQEKALYLVGLVLLFVVGLFLYKTHNTNFFDNPEHWGIFGDYVGGTLNPILGFFSFMLLLLNLYLQRKQLDKTEEQLKLNREELKLTREELKKAADSQVDSVKVMNEQLKTQALQQFQSLYDHMIGQLEILLNKIDQTEIKQRIDNTNNSGEGFDCQFHYMGANEALLSYRDYMVLIFKKIDQATIGEKEKQTYVDLIKTPLTEKFLIALHLSFYCLLVDDSTQEILDSELNQILGKYQFFQNLKLIDFNHSDFTYNSIGLTKVLGHCVYGNNRDYEIIQASAVYKDIFDHYSNRNILQYIEDLCNRIKLLEDGNGDAVNFIAEWNISLQDVFKLPIAKDEIEISERLFTISFKNQDIYLEIEMGAQRVTLKKGNGQSVELRFSKNC